MIRDRSGWTGDESGSALLVSIMVLAALTLLGSGIVFNALSDRQISRYDRDSADALAAAETGVAVAKRLIQDLDVTLADADADGLADFEIVRDLPWNGRYRVFAEASDALPISSAFRSHAFNIIAEGEVRGARRRVAVRIVHDSFLKYAFFFQEVDLSFACRGLITGEVYAGRDLLVPSCASGEETTFLEMVSVVENILPSPDAARFWRGYSTDAQVVNLDQSVDFTWERDRARGLSTNNSCGGQGTIGLYVNSNAGSDPIGIAATGGVLDFSRFDFHDTWTSPGDTVIAYAGSPVIDASTGQPLRRADFNGSIFFEFDAHLKGVLDGVSACSMTIFANRNAYCDSSIVTGHTGFYGADRTASGTGDPVNLGIVARNDVLIGPVPRVCRFDVAAMAVNGQWHPASTDASTYPPLQSGPVDLDGDGNPNETPVNHDPTFGSGWDEVNITADHWSLTQNGPIITRDGGHAAPWIYQEGAGPTRHYNYDLDLNDFPPPCYPVPLNVWVDASWRELFNMEADLAMFTP